MELMPPRIFSNQSANATEERGSRAGNPISDQEERSMSFKRDDAVTPFDKKLTRRQTLGAGAGAMAATRLGGRSFVSAQTPASGNPVSPIAASGGLDDQEVHVFLFSGPENDAHKRLAPKFTDYTQGKVKVTVEEGGRDVDYTTKRLAALQAGTDSYAVIHSDAQDFLQLGPA